MTYGQGNSRKYTYAQRDRAGSSTPGSTTFIRLGDRCAVISAYSNNRGERLATVSCFVASNTVPAVLSDFPLDAIASGETIVRETASVPEAVSVAKKWCTGENVGTGDML